MNTDKLSAPPSIGDSARYALFVLFGEQTGRTFVMPESGSLTIGRMMHGLNFETDAAVSDPHAIFSVRGGRLFVKALPTPGGVYLRIRGERPIEPGTLFSIAGHHLRYLGPIPAQSDRSLYGAPQQQALMGVEELYSDGFRGCRVVRPAPRLIIGRSGCDMSFPDDRMVSERHAELSFEGGNAFLRDLGSSGGTFLRLSDGKETMLAAGDRLRIGAQFLEVRVEEQ